MYIYIYKYLFIHLRVEPLAIVAGGNCATGVSKDKAREHLTGFRSAGPDR